MADEILIVRLESTSNVFINDEITKGEDKEVDWDTSPANFDRWNRLEEIQFPRNWRMTSACIGVDNSNFGKREWSKRSTYE